MSTPYKLVLVESQLLNMKVNNNRLDVAPDLAIVRLVMRSVPELLFFV